MTQSDNDTGGFAKSAFKGAFFLSSLRWVIRLIGLISVSITARVLTPEDFGIHSSAAIVVGMFLFLQYGGIQEFLIKAQKVDESVINTSWTVRVGLSATVCLCTLAIAPFAPSLLNEPRVFDVLILYAFIPLIDAFANPRLMLLLRDMEFGELFKIRLIERLIAFVITIIAVLLIRNYWGIIIGAFFSSLTFTAYTYLRWHKLPRFDLTHIREIGGFASIAMVRGVTNHISNISDTIAARQFLDSGTFGGFHNTKELANNLVAELSVPIGTALLPAMSKLRENKERFASATRASFGAVCLLAVGLSLGLNLVAEEAVGIILGDQWLFAIPYLRVAAVLIGASSLNYVAANFLIALDKQSFAAAILVCQAITSIVVCWLLIGRADAIILMYGVLAINACVLVAMMATIAWLTGLAGRLFAVLIRPSLAGTVMLYLAPICYEYLSLMEVHIVLAAIAKVTIGGIIYASAIIGLWILSGRPEGPEQALLDRTGINWRAYFAKQRP